MEGLTITAAILYMFQLAFLFMGVIMFFMLYGLLVRLNSFFRELDRKGESLAGLMIKIANDRNASENNSDDEDSF